ncbi:MAG: hypothetical protein H7066_10100, partial [Cytophagaceae bacterium]|nr:hypothetical protein [Gemmatimonadaceae bacterium]
MSRREGLGLVLGGSACVSAALFLRTWEVPYLAGTLVATSAALAVGWRGLPRPAWVVLLGSCAAMAVACGFAWTSLGRAVLVDAPVGASTLSALREESAAVMAELQRSADRLLALPNLRAGMPVTAIEPALPSASLGEAAG